MKPWKTLDRRTVLDCGKFLVVEQHQVQLPDGRVIADWPWVRTPDYVNIVAETAGGRVLIFRQTKYSVEGVSFAPLGGYLEPGEDPLAAAKRELMEESGYEASEWIPLGNFAVDGNRGAGRAYFYYARGAVEVGAKGGDDLEEQELLRMSWAEVDQALEAGKFKLLPWVAIMSLARQASRRADACA